MLLEVTDLNLTLHQRLDALRSIRFNVDHGETLGIVGESGSGKTLTGLSLLGLNPSGSEIKARQISFNGKSLLNLKENRWREIRGRSISMISQNPMTALNPCLTIYSQVDEVIKTYFPEMNRSERRHRIHVLFNQVGISTSDFRLESYPHEFSGGMLQRVAIAMAIAGRPKLIIADEPTSALDANIEKQILELLRSIQKDLKISILLITHHLAILKDYSHRILVMYAGEIVESGTTEEVFNQPAHPYTKGLLASLPSRNQNGFRSRLSGIPGTVLNLAERPKGCQFQARCPKVQTICKSQDFSPSENEGQHFSRCISNPTESSKSKE
jgi:oligopeptide/dipeptide ABC transporter ATP-binding protein